MRKLSWVRSLLSSAAKKDRRKTAKPRNWSLEELENRTTPAVSTSVVSNVLTVSLGAASDSAFITNSASGIRIGTAANGTDVRTDTTGITAIVVQDSGSNASQAVSFDGTAYSLSGASGVNVSGIETVKFTTAVSASAGSISVAGATTAINLNAATMTAAGTQTYANPVTLGIAVNLTSGGTGVSLQDVTESTFLLTISGTGTAGSIAGTITGSGGLTMAGTGTLTVSGTNTSFTGPVSIAAGVLSVPSLAAIGPASGGALSINGGTLQYTGAGTDSRSNSFTIGASNATIDVTQAAANMTLVSTAGDVTLGNLTKKGSGTFTFNTAITGTPASDTFAKALSITAGTFAVCANSSTTVIRFTGSVTGAAGTSFNVVFGVAGGIVKNDNNACNWPSPTSRTWMSRPAPSSICTPTRSTSTS